MTDPSRRRPRRTGLPAAFPAIALALAGLVVAGLPAPAPAQTREPLSASDWLSGSVRGPQRESSAWRPGQRPPQRDAGPKPVAASGAVGAVQVSRLDGSNPDATGTLTARKAGLAPGLWQGSDAGDLARQILTTPARLPAMNALMRRLLSAQLAPPASGRSGQLFLARADRLLDMGALDQAQALLLAAGPGDPEVFRRLFDIALLQGDEGRACRIMDGTPGVAPSFSARIFCLAQTGDWAAAAISLQGAEALGLIEARQAVLLTHFLDDAFVDDPGALAPPDRITPLEFRIHEAIGQPLPTTGLPLAFAQSDLRLNNGWKARLEAAERLARAGAIPPATLRQIYAEQKPAASGGVWERAGAMRTMEAAIASGGTLAALPRAFDEFRRAGMADVLAGMVAADLPEPDPAEDGEAATIAGWLRQWQGLPVPAPVAILPELGAEAPPVPDSRQGESLLAAMADVDAGIEGDLPRAARGLAMLRALGLEGDAALAAAQLSLLPAMGDAR
ncbi:hypothetical protein [Paracoccus spongiarum]|uniref:Antifreeze glycopeptide polyprotein n=1 Tax=Paracoccus spongiarum TaxID=3064387 RepID=A0ABT9J838_9RHOB|nr:hypothetical protein [Paracoccus sp. 2205BS29-5]MDP5305969.1 hypothetical protein [Paracoccus sp. 2205BS29-5]